MIRFLIISAFCFAAPFLASAQDVDPGKLESLKQEQEKQEKLEKSIKAKREAAQKEIKGLKKKLLKSSSSIQSLESQQAAARDQLSELLAQKDVIGGGISENKKSLQNLLAALQRIENNPPPALAAGPNDAANAARAGILMSGLSQQIETRVADLLTELKALDTVEVDILLAQEELEKSKQEIQKQRSSLQSSVDKKNKLEQSLAGDFDQARKRSKALANEAKTLTDLIVSLEIKTRDLEPRLKPDPNAPSKPSKPASSYVAKPLKLDPDALRFINAKGKLSAPVNGRLAKRYSSSHPGLTVRVAGESQVTAPISGRVDFAGPFKDYDNVVILNVGDGYFVLLTGLNQLYVQNGSMVSRGEAVGLMTVNSRSGLDLYIEVRKNGSTIDPAPWFGTTFAKQRNG